MSHYEEHFESIKPYDDEYIERIYDEDIDKEPPCDDYWYDDKPEEKGNGFYVNGTFIYLPPGVKYKRKTRDDFEHGVYWSDGEKKE